MNANNTPFPLTNKEHLPPKKCKKSFLLRFLPREIAAVVLRVVGIYANPHTLWVPNIFQRFTQRNRFYSLDMVELGDTRRSPPLFLKSLRLIEFLQILKRVPRPYFVLHIDRLLCRVGNVIQTYPYRGRNSLESLPAKQHPSARRGQLVHRPGRQAPFTHIPYHGAVKGS